MSPSLPAQVRVSLFVSCDRCFTCAEIAGTIGRRNLRRFVSPAFDFRRFLRSPLSTAQRRRRLARQYERLDGLLLCPCFLPTLLPTSPSQASNAPCSTSRATTAPSPPTSLDTLAKLASADSTSARAPPLATGPARRSGRRCRPDLGRRRAPSSLAPLAPLMAHRCVDVFHELCATSADRSASSRCADGLPRFC